MNYLHQRHRKLMSPDIEIILSVAAWEFELYKTNVCLRVLASCRRKYSFSCRRRSGVSGSRSASSTDLLSDSDVVHICQSFKLAFVRNFVNNSLRLWVSRILPVVARVSVEFFLDEIIYPAGVDSLEIFVFFTSSCQLEDFPNLF